MWKIVSSNQLIQDWWRWWWRLKFVLGGGKLYPQAKRLKTKIGGLKFRPSIEPEDSDKADMIRRYFWLKKVEGGYCTKRDIEVVRKELKRLGSKCRCILEIGVRDEKTTTTRLLVKNKPKGAVYLGVDIEGRSSINDSKARAHTLQTDSRRRRQVYKKMCELGRKEVDLLLIDGWHSVEMVVNDWQYTKYLSKHGVVIFHDTSVHPGPYLLFKAIDEREYDKIRYFASLPDDWGMGVARRYGKI